MNKPSLLFMSFFLIVTQSCLLGATKTPIIPDSPPTTKMWPTSIWIDDESTLPNCKHHQCCGCEFYLKKLNQLAQGVMEAKWVCAFHTNQHRLNLLTLYTHIRDTFEHLHICMKAEAEPSLAIIVSLLEGVGVDITNYLVQYSDAVICNTMLHEAAKDGNIMMLKYFIQLFLQKKLSLNSQASNYSFRTPLGLAATAECVEELRGAITISQLMSLQ